MPKFTITLKDPDGVSDSVCEAADSQVQHLQHEMLPREYEAVREKRGEALFEALRKWVEHDEYIRIEIDTDAGTATVLEVKR